MHGPEPPPLITLHRNLAAAVLAEEEQAPRWISGSALRGHGEPASRLLEALTGIPDRTGPLADGEDPAALRVYLLAADQPTLATASLGGFSNWIGAATTGGAALLNLNGPGYRAVGSPDAARELARWVDGWRAAGRPGLDMYRPVLTQVERGWRASLTSR